MVTASRKRFVGPLCILALAATTSCATATRFHTDPEGATLYVNGKLIGETPVVYDNDHGLPRRYHVQLYKDGYESLDFYLDTRISWLWGYVGLVTIVPYFWAWSLAREYELVLTPKIGFVPPDDEEEDEPAPCDAPCESGATLPGEVRL